MEQDDTQMKLMPAPIGGWNAKDPLHAMPESDAVQLVNYFPDVGTVKRRGGTRWRNDTGDANDDVHQLFPLQQYVFYLWKDASAGFTAKLNRWSFTGGTDVNVSGAVVFDTTNEYTWTVFKNYVFAFSLGAFDPFYVTTAGNAATLAYTGGPAALTDLTGGDSYKGRLYLVDFTTNIYYSGIDSIAGPLSTYNLDMFMRKGGFIAAVASTTKQGGDSNEARLVAITNFGELFVFAGDYPGSVTWELVGRYELSPPLGPRCFAYRGSDLFVLTFEGAVGLNEILSGIKTGDRFSTISDKISSAWATMANQSADTFYETPIYTTYMPAFRMFIVHTRNWGEWVQNTVTGAWTVFAPGDIYYYSPELTASFTSMGESFVVSGNKIWAIAKPNAIVEMYAPGTPYWSEDYSAATANYAPFAALSQSAFTFLNNIATTKHLTIIKAFFMLEAGTSHDESNRSIRIGSYTDFLVNYPFNSEIPEAILQDVTADGTVHYSLPCAVRADGSAFSIVTRSYLGEDYTLSLNAFALIFEEGGALKQ